jgi:microcystin-dependent protein
MGTGLHSGDWGTQTEGNLQKLESAIVGQLTTTTTGGTITLSDDQARNGILAFNGVLTSNLIVVVPARSKGWTILNQTTGAFTVTLKSAAGGTNTITIPANSCALYYCDATLVYSVAPPVNSESGKMSMFGGPAGNIPVNHLLCYGQAVSRTTYAALFAAIGTTHGAGDGTTTFNLPDMRGRAPVGHDSMGGVAAGVVSLGSSNLGAAFGEQNHVLITAEIPSHGHGVTDPGHVHGINDPSHIHSITESILASGPSANEAVPGGGINNATANTNASTTGISIQAAGTGISIQANGGGTSHNNLQPSMFLNIIIRI